MDDKTIENSHKSEIIELSAEIIELSAEIVAAYVGNNSVAPTDLPGLINDVH